MAGEISQQTGWKIRRVSLKARNDARAIPDVLEKAALEDFDRRAAAGESPAKLEKGKGSATNTASSRRCRCNPSGLGCHGPADRLSPAIKAMLDQNYPNDRATGYSEGQIRGVISVRRTL